MFGQQVGGEVRKDLLSDREMRLIMEKGKIRPTRMFRLKQQIFAFLVVFIVVILLLLGIFLLIMIGAYQKNQNQRRLNDLQAYAQTLQDTIGQLSDATGSVYSMSAAFQGIGSYQTAAEMCGYVYELKSLLQVQLNSTPCLSGMFIHYDGGDSVLYSTADSLPYADTKMLWNIGKNFMKNSRMGLLVESSMFSYVDGVQKSEEDLFYSVYIKRNSAMVSGSVSQRQGLPEQLENEAAYGIVYEGEFYRTGGQDGGHPDINYATLRQGRNRVGNDFVYLHKLDTEDMAVVEILPSSLWLYVQPWHLLLAVLMLLLMVWLLSLYRFVYQQLSEPLEDMTRALREIRKGDWEVEFTAPNRIVEIENVRQTVRLMLKEIGQYKIRTYEEQLERQKTQLQFLQLQLAPHFYTNCLKNIYYMLMMEEYGNAEQFLLRLSTHLRYLLQRDVTLVTVQTEREFVENYISLQKLLTSRPLTCMILVEEAVREQEIPILALQTFVENSVKYTETDRERPLEIRIQVRLIKGENGESLDIVVRDNGAGYPGALLALLNQKGDMLSDKGFGVGILNLLNRLRIHYGEDAQWYFDNRDGAFSELILPVGMENGRENGKVS